MIVAKYCTWHDSCAVVACAKHCSDMIPYNGVTLKPIFHFPSNVSFDGKIAMKWATDLVLSSRNDRNMISHKELYNSKPSRIGGSVILSPFWKHGLIQHHQRSGIGMRPANERRRYNVTSSLIDWAHTHMYCRGLCLIRSGQLEEIERFRNPTVTDTITISERPLVTSSLSVFVNAKPVESCLKKRVRYIRRTNYWCWNSTK